MHQNEKLHEKISKLDDNLFITKIKLNLSCILTVKSAWQFLKFKLQLISINNDLLENYHDNIIENAS